MYGIKYQLLGVGVWGRSLITYHSSFPDSDSIVCSTHKSDGDENAVFSLLLIMLHWGLGQRRAKIWLPGIFSLNLPIKFRKRCWRTSGRGLGGRGPGDSRRGWAINHKSVCRARWVSGNNTSLKSQREVSLFNVWKSNRLATKTQLYHSLILESNLLSEFLISPLGVPVSWQCLYLFPSWSLFLE